MFFESHHESDHKIIFLIAPPRSNSTIFLRMMLARGDMQVLMEPGHYAYYKSLPELPVLPELTLNLHNKKIDNFHDLITYIENLSQVKNAFIKEMCVAAKEYLTPNSSFLSNKNAYFFFLLRNPKNTIIS